MPLTGALPSAGGSGSGELRYGCSDGCDELCPASTLLQAKPGGWLCALGEVSQPAIADAMPRLLEGSWLCLQLR